MDDKTDTPAQPAEGDRMVMTGGDAFPMPDDGWPGMSLLDYFAGQALQGILSHGIQGLHWDHANYQYGVQHHAPEGAAAQAFAFAEAMVAESARRQEGQS